MGFVLFFIVPPLCFQSLLDRPPEHAELAPLDWHPFVAHPEEVGVAQPTLLVRRSMTVTPSASATEQVIPSEGFAIARSI